MVKLWNTESLEIYLPIICPNCQESVGFSGVYKDDKIIADCPNCKEVYEIDVKGGADEQIEQNPLEKAVFSLKIENLGKITCMEYKVESTTPMHIIMDIIDTLARLLSSDSLPFNAILDLVTRELILNTYNKDGLDTLVEYIKSIRGE